MIDPPHARRPIIPPAALIEEFLDRFDIDQGLDVVLDPGAVITHAYLAPADPTTYFIDRDGFVRYRRFGEVKAEHLEVGLGRTLSPREP